MTNTGQHPPELVLGLRLPPALGAAIAADEWRAPADRDVLEAVFADEAALPYFYGPADIERETLSIRDTTPDYYEFFVGKPPYDIDLHQCLVIGGLGPDQPFALDYRRATTAPRVLYLREVGWTEVATDIETLMARLRIGPIPAGGWPAANPPP
ncbi:hypothetical protein AB0M43_23080 [Longispora sp. NPDC051575]|uniref:hypothetical protein n=1 Tax=Longispora sp. NPDC051575 TaxID=3154943 RepID=UPI003426885D